MEVSVYKISGEDTGKKVTLNDSVFGIEPNDHAIYLDAKQYMANNRQGTHKAKGRKEVSGSTRKLKKQKGTGTARAGSIKSPLYRGGGRIFGPEPRDYRHKLNRKLKELARKSALSYKAKENSIIVLEDFSFEQPKTKNVVTMLNKIKSEKKSLIILSEPNNSIYLSSRNLQDVKVIIASELTTYEVLKANKLILTEGSVAVINELFNN